MTASSKRAEYVAWASLILNVVFFAIALLVGRWSGFFVVSAVSWLILSSAIIWFVLVIQFHQRSLAEQEKLDMSQLAGAERDSTIFRAKGEHATLFAVAQRRLQVLEKWFIPVFAALTAVYQAGIGLYLLKGIPAFAGMTQGAGAEVETKQPLVCAICMTAIAFVSFLMSRYAIGMSASSSEPGWKPLRAGGSSLIGTAVVCFTLAVALAFVQFNVVFLINIIGYVIPVLLIVLGVETGLNVILDIYRPRIKGQYGRAAFDSRLLGIISEPGEILHTAAGAIDYQFGFKVSQTWFYKLLAKAIVPLILFACITLYLLSCIVVVAPNEESIIEHFGNPVNDAGKVRLVGPGLTFKYPWPIDIAYKYPTKKIRELYIGYVPKTDPKTGQVIRERELLWGKSHYEQEYNVLVASEQTTGEFGEGAVPVSLVKANVPVHYRIKDLYSFIYEHNKPKELLESICYRELAKFTASARIEVDDQAGIEHSLLGSGRAEAKRILTDRIQKAADAEHLGVEIVFLGLQGVHPPPEVAADYQKVVGAVQKKQALILGAHAERNKTLSSIAGSVSYANHLYDLAAEYQSAKGKVDAGKIRQLAVELDEAFAQAKGDIFATLRKSQSYAFEKATLAEAVGRRFSSQLNAYRAAKEIYKQQQRLMVLEDSMSNIRKYVVTADANDTQVFIVDVQEKLTPSLYELTGLEEHSKK
ncbi:MAG: hypothetical protein DRP62_01750 [Planctomycetota bacterium]|nr:MAG: hypothetical protein DRP62_01750 [Planctomycetota bacterium]